MEAWHFPEGSVAYFGSKGGTSRKEAWPILDGRVALFGRKDPREQRKRLKIFCIYLRSGFRSPSIVFLIVLLLVIYIVPA